MSALPCARHAERESCARFLTEHLLVHPHLRPLSGRLPVMMTCAFFLTSSSAAASPMPLVPPAAACSASRLPPARQQAAVKLAADSQLEEARLAARYLSRTGLAGPAMAGALPCSPEMLNKHCRRSAQAMLDISSRTQCGRQTAACMPTPAACVLLAATCGTSLPVTRKVFPLWSGMSLSGSHTIAARLPCTVCF